MLLLAVGVASIGYQIGRVKRDEAVGRFNVKDTASSLTGSQSWPVRGVEEGDSNPRFFEFVIPPLKDIQVHTATPLEATDLTDTLWPLTRQTMYQIEPQKFSLALAKIDRSRPQISHLAVTSP